MMTAAPLAGNGYPNKCLTVADCPASCQKLSVITDEIRFNLHNSLSDEQKTVLKREFLLYWMVQTLRIDKKSALLLEWVKYHFPDEMAEIEHFHNEEYQKQREVIQQQIEKIQSKDEELKEVA